MSHIHSEIPKHTPEQTRMFFALAKDLGYTSSEVKERAKEFCRVECFNEITKQNLMRLIDLLVKKQDERQIRKTH